MRAAEAFLALAVCVASRAALGAIDKTGIGSAEAGKLCGLSGALKATARRALEEAAALRGKVAAAAQAMEEAEEALSEAGLKADTKGSALLDDMLRVTLDNGTKTGRTALIAQLALHAQETAADLARRATNTAGKIDQWVNTAFSIISEARSQRARVHKRRGQRRCGDKRKHTHEQQRQRARDTKRGNSKHQAHTSGVQERLARRSIRLEAN
ncbi:hypothetical protein ERJ75_001688700 [Trypanosoma vivax]|nr:hypothetical protein ERJ75_001688700 [Trypanosoma vivax]